MGLRSMLVYYPGYPFDWAALTPKRAAASAAGSLIEAGIDCEVRDFGTLTTLERLTPPGAQDEVARAMNRVRGAIRGAPFASLSAYAQVTRVNAVFRKLQRAHCTEIGESLAREKGCGFVAFLVQTSDDAYCVNRIAAAAKARNADLPLAAFGPFVAEYGDALRRCMPNFDWFCGTETGLAEFAGVARERSRWNLMTRKANAHLHRWSGPFATAPAPNYDADVYPAVSSAEKLLVFEVEDSCSETGDSTELRLRPVEEICNQIWQLRAQFGAGLIRFTGRSTPPLHFRSILNGLGRRGVDILYSRRQTPGSADTAFFPIESAAGCVLHTHAIYSGSQWLHDRFYRTGSTVTQMESVLRASKDAGIETVAELTFPCPADDYHTRDETVRLIRRTAPHAASIRLPKIVPSSHWMRDPKRHGFELPRVGLAARAMKCLSMYPLARHQWERAAYNMRGRGASEVQRDIDVLRADMAELGVHPFDGEIASLVRAATGESNSSPGAANDRRPFVEFDLFVSAVDACGGMAAASREHDHRATASGLRPVAGDG